MAGTPGYQSSFPTMNGHKTFSDAFANAHSRGGPGHVFEYNGKPYVTDRADGLDCRATPDTRSAGAHEFRAGVHTVNAAVKDNTGIHLQDRLRNASYGRGFGYTSSETDRQRTAYHEREAEKQRAAAGKK